MGSTVAGPFCGRLLADFGADVINVETAEGDPVRTVGKRFHGVSLFADLAARCDVVVENFRPGGLEKWGQRTFRKWGMHA